MTKNPRSGSHATGLLPSRIPSPDNVPHVGRKNKFRSEDDIDDGIIEHADNEGLLPLRPLLPPCILLQFPLSGMPALQEEWKTLEGPR